MLDPGMADLFEAAGLTPEAPSPLAERLRPQRLDEVVGQDHLLGPDGPIRRMADALPVAASTSTTAPPRRGSPVATSKELGTKVTVVNSTRSTRRPRMLSYGPVMPTSVMKAVPPGRICSSAVGTCVCVPRTALTLPLR